MLTERYAPGIQAFLNMKFPQRGSRYNTRLYLKTGDKDVSSRRAVVIGGGPAGLSAALVLAKHHGFNVTLLEAASETDIASYDRSRAYLYNVNPRGQVLTKRFPFLQNGLKDRGVGVTQFARLTVPADPNEIFTNEPFSRPITEEEKDKSGMLYWIPRHEFVKLYLDAIAAEDRIEICYGMDCSNIKPSSEGIEVTAVKKEDGSTVSYSASLVVGADGVNSKVRNLLTDESSPFSAWRNGRPRGFRARKWNSPSVGLRIKTLQLEPNFSIPVGNGTTTKFDVGSTANYQIRSVNKGPRNRIVLTILPVRNATAVRPCAICTLPNHEIWHIDNGPNMKAWFVRAFPRFSFDGSEGSLVAEDEWERFAASRGTKFPPCQFSPSLHVSSEDGKCGIVLVGDAIHCFPPDIGQGVNAALGDIAVLDDALSEKESMGDALKEYEQQRGPETRALIRLARFGAPYQYRQSSPILIFRRSLWLLNISIRLFLNKVSKGFVPKPAVLLMMNPDLSFQTVMRRADSVTVALCSAAALLAWRIFLNR
jgi:kynurenine 3-monooxygenase